MAEAMPLTTGIEGAISTTRQRGGNAFLNRCSTPDLVGGLAWTSSRGEGNWAGERRGHGEAPAKCGHGGSSGQARAPARSGQEQNR